MMTSLCDVIMKDCSFFNINPHYIEFGVSYHPYVGLLSLEISPIIFVTV